MIRKSSRRDTTMIIPEAGTPQSQREQTLRLHIGTAHAPHGAQQPVALAVGDFPDPNTFGHRRAPEGKDRN